MPLTFDDATTRLVQSRATTPVVSRTVTLTVTEGPDSGTTLPVSDPIHRQVFVGKSAACDLRLTDPTVSRRHLALELDESGLVLRDLHSRNGTEVDGLVVREVVLGGGEIVKIGGSAFRVDLADDPHPIAVPQTSSFGPFVGASPAARRLYTELERLAQTNISVLLEGEAGTGKELLAVALHEAGARSDKPFVVFERGEGSVLDAEAALFGRGETAGLLEQANGGTLFFHEVADLENGLQMKLLDSIERKSVRRAGVTSSVSLDVRYLASTSRDLDREVQEHRFSEELVDRLSAARVVVPPLRRRREDIAILAQLFWARFGGNPVELSPALVQKFEERSWQGNVRELAKTVAGHLAARGSATGVPDDSFANSADIIGAVLQRGVAFTPARAIVTAEFERRFLEHMLKLHKGNVTRAAAAAGISRRYFYRVKTRA